jgi:hypothetical protein
MNSKLQQGVKIHAQSMTSPLNPHIKLTKNTFYSRLAFTFRDESIDTGQLLVDENGIVIAGKWIFEDAVKVKNSSKRAAKAIWENMLDRRGIKQALECVDDDVKKEILEACLLFSR